MNKGIVVGVVALIGLLGGGYYLYSQSQANVDTGNQAAQVETETSASTTNSLKSLFALGSSQECTFTDVEGLNSGTVYVASGKVHGNFYSSVGEVQMNTNMISDGTHMYMWLDGQTTGFKTSVAAMEEATSNGGVSSNGSKSVDLNKQVDYSCKPWTVDAAKFVPPASIEFTDYSQISATLAVPNGAMDTSNQCAACAALPAAAQSQCKAALNCQ